MKHHLRKGQTCGGYRILGVLGAGSMGSVLLARQLSINRLVALKVLPPQLVQRHPHLAGLFLREARGVAQLDHPGIIRVHDAGTIATADGPIYYFAMEYVDGESLAAILDRAGACDGPTIAAVMRTMAEVLVYAHRKELVHRDIKPANILRARGGAIKLGDFGLIQLQGEPGTDRVMGTPGYMSPEQACGLGVDHCSDQYSLGCTLFHMLTGAPPFHGSEARSVLQSHVHDPVPDPDALRTEPSPWSALCRRLMAKAPAERFVDPGELQSAVASILAEGSRTTTSGRRRRPHTRRSRPRTPRLAQRSRPRDRAQRGKRAGASANKGADAAQEPRRSDPRRNAQRPAAPKATSAATPQPQIQADRPPPPPPPPPTHMTAAPLRLPLEPCARGLRRLAIAGARVSALPLAPGWRVRVVLGRHHLLTAEDDPRACILALPRERMLPLVLQTVLAERVRARRLDPQAWLTESLAFLSRALEQRWQTVPAAMRLRRPLQRLRSRTGPTGPLLYEPATHGRGGSEIIALARTTGAPILPVSYSAIPGALWGRRRCLVAAPLATILVGFAAPLVPDPAQPPQVLAAALDARMRALNRDLDRRSGLAD